MKTKNNLLLIALFITLISCDRRNYTEIPLESKIVVEGRIEESEYATVLLSKSVPVSIKIDSSNFLKYVIRSAMVIVSNSTESDTLILMTSNTTIPPYIYRGDKIKGRAGETYLLKVKYLDSELTAVTFIPPSVEIDNVKYNKKNVSDTIGTISIEFTDPASEKNYYQIATKLKNVDDVFVPALYGNLNDANFSRYDVKLEITRGITIFPKTNLQSQFNNGDTVYVKLCTQSKEGFEFWNSWQNEIINTQNPIFPANSNLKGNLKGGVGIWMGYGKSERMIIAK